MKIRTAEGEGEYGTERERRRRRWSEMERKMRKERRHPRVEDYYGTRGAGVKS
ncbi:MAG: hypothetical protein HYZ75_17110 [Elusimicrobia bacterium]|nr:hypothetical protein [Elusimicrobiota bacterium]